MCLILFAINPSPEYRLIVAANRDEMFARETQSADFWDDGSGILAGKDIQAGGTWLGVNREGRFAAVTNFREEPPSPLPPLSRGDLPTGFLAGQTTPRDYIETITGQAEDYRGFNLICADSDSMGYYCNRSGVSASLGDGYYGLSNQILNCDWPKVVEGKNKLREILQNNSDDLIEALFAMLLDGGDGREFSNSFIKAETYGTRAMTVVTIGIDNQVFFEERNFGPMGVALDRTLHHW